MVDSSDPNTWTKQYVRSHRGECLSFLKETNMLVIRYVRQNNYTAAIAGLDRILNGLMTMQNSGCGDYWTTMSVLSMAEGILLTFFGSRGIPNAIKVLKDAKDFARKPKTKQDIDAILVPLQAGKPLDAHPSDVIELLQMVNPKLTSAISGSGTSSGRSAPPPASDSVDWKFELWVNDCGWDEDDLERYYKKIRFRRNLYGLCLLGGPLGVLIFPFWLRAVYITKSVRHRTYAVDFSFLTKIMIVLFGLPTLFIYPWIMGKIIAATNWGMGMGDRRAWIPIIATIVLIVGLFLSGGGLNSGLLRNLAAVPGQIFSSPRPSSAPEDGGPDRDLTEDAHRRQVTLRGWNVSMVIPQEMEELCLIETGSSSMTFLHKATREADGLLFYLTVDKAGYGEDGGPPAYQVVAEKDGVSLIAIFPTDVQFDDPYAEEYSRLQGYIPGILDSVEFQRAYPVSCLSDPDASDTDLLEFAKEAYCDMTDMRNDLYSGFLLEWDWDDYITLDENGYGDRYYRVPGCAGKAELRSALEDVWYQSFSRRYPLDPSVEDMYLEHNGAIYVMPDWSYIQWSDQFVEQMDSRTDSEAVFSGYIRYALGDTEEFQCSLVYEDGIWKFGFMS